ncbi:helix-turn-helix domain-containing protein [Micromonospora sp. WMMC250]|uniref:helix-turn-helix domain-containing protein n=1 Tax=Micromonospora sp. WMMC250 TaxID=3014781 RepID=UPI0022B6C84B|nr:helix-turn-helix transcriptional regulator [Micromonospora sp. WMMC250]MCZ7377117.1 helix-turn-helix transcriptional regulator [Micromonospora sp. WMMC250]
MDATNQLGDFLRARREQIRPEDVGLGPGVGLRRVPGLRREEVAMLAGISADYYLRLEQGRERHPSVQVLDALAGVLRLDPEATAYMIGLTRVRSRRAARPSAERVPASILHLLRQLSMPAFVQNRYLDILASNPMARALSPNLAPGVNRLRAVFLDEAEQNLFRDWRQAMQSVVGQMRADSAGDADDPRLAALVGELSIKSDCFRRLWARHEVRRREGIISRLHHPEVGDLDLYCDKLAVAGADGQLLVIYHAEPGTESARSLALLGSIAASRADDVPDSLRPGDPARLYPLE